MSILKNGSLLECCKNGIFLFRQLSSYKSAISLANMYPQSSLKLSTVKPPPQKEEFNGYIPIDDLVITYSRSTGPGGQNVNKVNTKVDLRFHLETAKWLNDNVKKNLAEQLRSKITKDGFLVFKSDLTRFQQMNVADCLEKLRTAIREASKDKSSNISSETEELIRRRKEKAARERLTIKRHRSQIKADRQGPELTDL
ncbi:peptidyl-tRNA hydrolase ICT1, mitochondrial [Agrilus planipennis]|uniref:Large ribosomal subunit protein mL62 n=1 Tax=Agrilus planipennis TaxID=224129 RepID=A0A1W4WV33_AGRPL|nr:peptidyl-tRNA hydrolase ICT1, mitochondrial [Agrilus planipennis]